MQAQRTRRSALLGAGTAGLVLACGILAFGSDVGAGEMVVAGACGEQVTGPAGAEVGLAAAAVQDVIVTQLRELQPPPEVEPSFRRDWAAQPPVAVGTVLDGAPATFGPEVARAVVARLPEVPSLAGYAEDLAGPVERELTASCSITAVPLAPVPPSTTALPTTPAPTTTAPTTPAPTTTAPTTTTVPTTTVPTTTLPPSSTTGLPTTTPATTTRPVSTSTSQTSAPASSRPTSTRPRPTQVVAPGVPTASPTTSPSRPAARPPASVSPRRPATPPRLQRPLAAAPPAVPHAPAASLPSLPRIDLPGADVPDIGSVPGGRAPGAGPVDVGAAERAASSRNVAGTATALPADEPGGAGLPEILAVCALAVAGGLLVRSWVLRTGLPEEPTTSDT